MTPQPIRPVFVLGLQRSGTTWVANLLAAHPEIAGVAAAEHHGVHESVFFSHFAVHFGRWDDMAARERFLDAFLSSDYFRLTGLPADWARSLPAQSYGDLFRRIMNEFAEKRGARAWVEKSPHHSLIAERIAAEMPEALFICVHRETLSLLRSRLWSYGRRPPPYPRRAWSILAGCASNCFHGQALEAFRRARPGTIRIDFEDLQAGAVAALAPAWTALGVEAPRALSTDYAANSSFADQRARERALGPLDRALARIAIGLVMVVPYPALALMQRLRAMARPRRFPPWVWRSNPAPIGPEAPR